MTKLHKVTTTMRPDDVLEDVTPQEVVDLKRLGILATLDGDKVTKTVEKQIEEGAVAPEGNVPK
jgi:hypothetical protein